ncbi:MAG: RNA methyltransferase, partial [Oscillospiraceae bacterium]
GAIIRTAECVGAHGVVIPKRGNCTVTSTVHRASAGACSCIKIAKIGNLASEIKEIKKRGVFCYCADMDGQNCYRADLTGPVALIVGSEGFGVSRLVKELCDVTVSIPMKGQINSLNSSVAAAVLMYEFLRQRSTKV